MMKRGCHPNPKLQNIFKKYGVPNFHVLEDVSVKSLDEREQFYLDLLFELPECLNIACTAGAPMRGRKFSEVSKKKLCGRKAWNKGKVLTNEEKQAVYDCNTQKIPVLQFSKDGIFIREWTSATVASKELFIPRTSIQKVCRGVPKYKTAGGFIWKYKS